MSSHLPLAGIRILAVEQYGAGPFGTAHLADLGASQQTRRNDTRVTRLGALLRRTSLDELPQLLNVLGGSM